MAIIYLGLGTNMGNREQHLREALHHLPPQVTVAAISRLYETVAAYVIDQPAFLNLAVRGRTELSPMALLAYLKDLEGQLGRQKTFRYGPRQIDIDILFYDNLVMESPALQIPHPRLPERPFVLYPLLDLTPQLLHPQRQQTMQQLAAQLPPNDGILEVRELAILQP